MNSILIFAGIVNVVVSEAFIVPMIVVIYAQGTSNRTIHLPTVSHVMLEHVLPMKADGVAIVAQKILHVLGVARHRRNVPLGLSMLL